MALSKPTEYNILLLGESGNGKSLFINSFANYLKHETFGAACACADITCLVPTKDVLLDAEDVEKVVEYGNHDNESMKLTKSGTMSSRSYAFEVNGSCVRLIDSAGVGAAEGTETDCLNMNDVLDYIDRFEKLHAIAIVLKANQTKLNNHFQYCMTQLLTKLNKSAINNIIFLITFCDKKQIQVKHPLKSYLEEMNKSSSETCIELTDDRVYKFDNMAFIHLLAIKQGIQIDEDSIKDCEKAWKKSSKECQRLLQYVMGYEKTPGLKPHHIKATKAMKEARKFIEVIKPFIDEILTTIENNRERLKSLTEEYQRNTAAAGASSTVARAENDENLSNKTSQLRKSMTVIQLEDIKVTALTEAQTICTSKDCTQEYKVGNLVKQHFPQICCQGCPIPIGRRLFCSAFNLISGLCKICECHVNDHQRCYFKTEKVTRDIPLIISMSEDATQSPTTQPKPEVESVESKRNRMLIQTIKDEQAKLEHEKDVMERAMVKFAQFLKANAIAEPSKELLEEYERKTKHVQKVGFDQFEQAPPPSPSKRPTSGMELDKCVADLAKSTPSKVSAVTSAEIFVIRQQLFDLELYGPKIESVWDIVKRAKEGQSRSRETSIQLLKSMVVKDFQWLSR